MSLTIDDLIQKCPSCGGLGQDPQRTSGSNTSGYGQQVVYYGDTSCNQCMGVGRWGLTETGKVLVKFAGITEKLKQYGRLEHVPIDPK
jgi:hypothetical protein